MSRPTQRDDLLNRLRRAKEVEIAVTGRKTKRRISTPVWFVLDGEKVVLVPVKGSGTQWFKNLEKNPRIELGVGGTAMPFKGRISRDSKQVEPILDRFRAKYGSMWSESYYTKRDAYVEVPV